MQTFLPSGYNFAPNRLVNPSNYQSAVADYILEHNTPYIFMIMILLCVALIALSIIVDSLTKCSFHIKNKKMFKLVNNLLAGVTNIEIAGMMVICAVAIALVGSHFVYTLCESTEPKVYYRQALFKFPIRSNLKVHMLNSDHQPKNIDDHRKYPYKIYLNNPKKYNFRLDSNNWQTSGNYQLYTKKKIYLGKVQDGKFTPANNSLAAQFNKYHTYIMKHHLTNKFSKKMMFKPNGNHTTINGNVQWTISNDKDLVLYLHNGSEVKKAKIVNSKE